MYATRVPMLNLRQALADDILSGIEAAQAKGDLPKEPKKPPLVVVRHGENPEHGDYASPVALSLTKIMRRPPMEIIEAIAKHMPKREYLGKLEAAAPGFLNIRLNPGWMTARLDNIVKEELCEAGGRRAKSINLEFISANPTGPLTLGNARTAFSVDTLANVLTCAGLNVTREYYINDAGQQIYKLGESVLRRTIQAQGHRVEYPDEMYQGDYIKELAKKIAEEWQETEGREFKKEDLADAALITKIGEQAADSLLQDIKKTIAHDMRIRFDVWTSERALRESGKIEKAVERLRQKGATYKKEKAEYLKTTDFGDSEDRILIKSDGEYAYIAPDIGYHQDKFDRKYDEIYTFVGADHQGHGPKLKAAMEALGNDGKKLHIVAAQWMRMVKSGEPVKMSKRRGNIYTPEELIKEVGYDAARFFMVQHALTTHMDFDLDLAQERSERNPVYYAQYAYVRLQSILRRAKEAGVIKDEAEKMTGYPELTHTTELNLMREMYKFPEVVDEIAKTFEVQALPYYALGLARAVHVFYKNVPVIATENEEVRKGRLLLVVAARKVMGQALNLLGIGKPDVM